MIRGVAGFGNLTSSFYRNVVIRGFESGYQRRRIFPYLKQLEHSQWLGRAELARLQLDALKRLLLHAQQNCPYYREAWRAAGLQAADLRQLDDFVRWPLVRRETIRQNRQGIRACTPRLKMIAKATGGSSGEPLLFELDSNSNDRRMAATARGYAWAGAALGTKQFHLWGVPLGAMPEWKKWKLRLYDALYRREVVSSFGLSDETVPQILARLQRCRPDVIVAYTNPLYFFARAIRERGLRPPPVRSIVVGAEKLHGFQRGAIEDVFAAPVFETYGSREFMLMAAECDRHEGLHLTFEHLLVEVVDSAGKPAPEGAEGDVVVTDLYNYGMPFVRYVNGDRAIAGFGTCSCGRGLPILRRIVGRQLDIVTTPDGRHVPGEFFPHMLKDHPAVRKFQVVQERIDDVRLRLVLSRPDEAALDAIRREVSAALGPRVSLKIEVVDDIPLSPAGKLQVVVSRIQRPAHPDDAM
jgi:phenylacetate-CoA ligase